MVHTGHFHCWFINFNYYFFKMFKLILSLNAELPTKDYLPKNYCQMAKIWPDKRILLLGHLE